MSHRKQWETTEESRQGVEIPVMISIMCCIKVFTGRAAVGTPWYVYSNLMKEEESSKDEMKAASEKSN